MIREVVKIHRDGREVCQKNAHGKYEYQQRTLAMYERQGYKCAIHGGWMRPEEVQFDHEAGRGSGGGHRDDRIEIDDEWINAAVCGACNGAKGSQRYSWQDGKYLPIEKASISADPS